MNNLPRILQWTASKVNFFLCNVASSGEGTVRQTIAASDFRPSQSSTVAVSVGEIFRSSLTSLIFHLRVVLLASTQHARGCFMDYVARHHMMWVLSHLTRLHTSHLGCAAGVPRCTPSHHDSSAMSRSHAHTALQGRVTCSQRNLLL